MKKIIIIFLSIYALGTTISCTVTSTNNDCLMWRNRELNSMCEAVVEYADSTADTGEMDDLSNQNLVSISSTPIIVLINNRRFEL